MPRITWRMQLAKADPGWTVWIHGVDTGQSSSAFQVCWATGEQASQEVGREP